MKLNLSIFLLLIFSFKAHAFPEMVRHHYVNCNACHVNPNGGGLLTQYGRGMAGEVLSTWSYENESLFMHGALKPEKIPEWLHIGGDARAVQTHRETRKLREGKYILMQTALETGITAGPVTAVASYFQPDRQNHVVHGLGHYYLLGNITETVQVKAGRFLPAFGLHVPHHTVATRQALGFGYDSDRNAVEAHYNGEQWHAAFGGSESRNQSALRQEELAVSAQVERFFADKYRIGVSAWRGKSQTQERSLMSAHGMLGFTERFYFLGEAALQHRQPAQHLAPLEKGIFQFGRLGYELFKGFHLLAVEDFSQARLSKPNTLTIQLGAGVLWYPRPHFELELVFSQKKTLLVSPEFEDSAYLMLHYYL